MISKMHKPLVFVALLVWAVCGQSLAQYRVQPQYENYQKKEDRVDSTGLIDRTGVARLRDGGQEVQVMQTFLGDLLVAETVSVTQGEWLWTKFFGPSGKLVIDWSKDDYTMYSAKGELLLKSLGDRIKRHSNSTFKIEKPDDDCVFEIDESPGCSNLIYKNGLVLQREDYMASPITVLQVPEDFHPVPTKWDKENKVSNPVRIGIWSPFDFSHAEFASRLIPEFLEEAVGQTHPVYAFGARSSTIHHDTQMASLAGRGSGFILIAPAPNRSMDGFKTTLESFALWGVEVVGASFAGTPRSRLLDPEGDLNLIKGYGDLVAKYEKKMLIVSSAGNTGDNNDEIEHYPSNLNAPNTIAVTGIGRDGDLIRVKGKLRANYSENKVDVAAPVPGNLFAANVDGGIRYFAPRTSHASQFVTNLAAKVLLINPDLEPSQVKEMIVSTVDGFDKYPKLRGKVKYGVVNPERALKAAKASIEQSERSKDK